MGEDEKNQPWPIDPSTRREEYPTIEENEETPPFQDIDWVGGKDNNLEQVREEIRQGQEAKRIQIASDAPTQVRTDVFPTKVTPPSEELPDD